MSDTGKQSIDNYYITESQLKFLKEIDLLTEGKDKKKKYERTSSGKIRYRGELFPGFNKPKRYTGKGKYKHRVLAKEGDKIRVVNFGHKDYKDYTQHENKKRKKNFRSRHGCDKKKSKLTAGYWACKYLWSKKDKKKVNEQTSTQNLKENKKKDTKLCARGKRAAKAKYDVYPSAYANGYAVQVCKGKKPGLDGKKKASSGWSK